MSSLGKFLGELEKEIMDVIWSDNQPLTVRIVYESISKKRNIAYTTVMTIMGRLVEKGVLERELKGASYFYEPKVTRERFVAKSVHNIFTTAISALGQEAVAHFVKEIQKMSPKKRSDLLKMLDNE